MWFVWLPHYRPALKPGERYGIDVSHHQGLIDWRRVAADDIMFAYIKASEGTDHRDRRFIANWQGAAEVGIERGAYHFFTLCSAGEAQARNFLDAISPDEDAMPPAVDLEIAGNCASPPGPAVIQAELNRFLQILESEWGRPALLYVGDDFRARYGFVNSLDRPIWHRRFLLRPDIDGWVVWQVTGWAHVDGIDGDVDLDVTAAQLPPADA
ncbi:MAG: lysozyme M1 (1,4-beta-N-acetylmuramidase) [Actinomycetota bacterium]|nr:lysozyme M1 (1,4-beta-N-acetylmuramidase) [Actinomycetota bacterium]